MRKNLVLVSSSEYLYPRRYLEWHAYNSNPAIYTAVTSAGRSLANPFLALLFNSQATDNQPKKGIVYFAAKKRQGRIGFSPETTDDAIAETLCDLIEGNEETLEAAGINRRFIGTGITLIIDLTYRRYDQVIKKIKPSYNLRECHF